jgi:hypothetical protein
VGEPGRDDEREEQEIIAEYMSRVGHVYARRKKMWLAYCVGKAGR